MRRTLVAVGSLGVLGLVLFLVLSRGKDHPRSGATPAAGAAAQGTRAATPPAGPSLASVAGKVTDAAGAPLGGAVVRLAPREDRPGAPSPAVGTSAADGSFRIADLPPGRWRASATATGFLPGHVEAVELRAGEEAPLAFRLEAGGRAVTGTVTDRSGGPVSGALVEASPVHGILSTRDPHTSAALTDAAGRYSLPIGQGRHRLRATHPEYVGEARMADIGPAGAVVDFTLMPGGVIEGIVREHGSGAPVPGAQVTHVREALTGLPFGERMAVTAGRGQVVSDAEGRFRITGLSPGAIRLTARAAGLATREPTLIPLGVAGQLSGVEVFVGGAYAVRGTVTIEGGGPAADVEVEAEGRGGVARAFSDAKGRFALDGLPPGDFMLTADGPGVSTNVTVQISLRDHDLDGVKLVVRAGAMIVGRVDPPGVAEVGSRREPTVSTSPAGEGHGAVSMLSNVMQVMRGPSTLTAPDGTFSLGPVEPGTVVVTARAADGRRGQSEVSVEPTGARGVIIHLETRAGLAGRVVTAAGTPLPGVTVHARRMDGDTQVTMVVNGRTMDAGSAPTGEGGRWEMLGLEAGSYQLSVNDDSGALAFAGDAPPEVSLRENERKDGVELTVQLNDGVIRGVVLAPDGHPLPDAWVSATPALELPTPTSTPTPGQGARVRTAAMSIITRDEDSLGGGGGPTPVLTDASGRFEISGLRHVKHRLLGEGLKGTARGLLDGVSPGSDVSLPLSELTRLEGKVTAAGKPVDEFTVDLSGAVRRSETFHAAGGAFTITRVDPGRYTVKVSATEGSGQADTVVAAAPAAAAPPVEVQLVGFGKVVGKLVTPDGAPAAGMPVLVADGDQSGSVRIMVTGGPPPTTGEDGSFSLDVAPGKHVLVVLGKGAPGARKPFDITSGQIVDLGTITLAPPPPPPPPPPPAPQKEKKVTSSL